MKFIKIYLLIAFFSILIGALLNFIWYLAGGNEVTADSLIFYMTVGLIFGSVMVSAMTLIFIRIRKPVHAYMINGIAEIILMLLLFLYQNEKCNQWDYIDKWIILLVVEEIVTTVLTAYWYKSMNRYNIKLANKKKNIEQL